MSRLIAFVLFAIAAALQQSAHGQESIAITFSLVTQEASTDVMAGFGVLSEEPEDVVSSWSAGKKMEDGFTPFEVTYASQRKVKWEYRYADSTLHVRVVGNARFPVLVSLKVAESDRDESPEEVATMWVREASVVHSLSFRKTSQ